MNVLHSAKIAFISILFFIPPEAMAGKPSIGAKSVVDCDSYTKDSNLGVLDRALWSLVGQIPNYNQRTPDTVEEVTQQIACMKKLLKLGADPERPNSYLRVRTFHDVVSIGDLELLKLFIEKGYDPKAPAPESMSHDSTLITAVRSGVPKEILGFLISKGVDLEASNKFGDTPLSVAASLGSKEYVEYLISKGADYKSPLINGDSVLHSAAMASKSDALEYLLKIKGLNPNTIKNSKGETALHWAAQAGRPKNIKVLLQAKADPNSKSKSGLTPLHSLVEFSRTIGPLLGQTDGDIESVDSLLAAGADINARDNEGETPLFTEVSSGNSTQPLFGVNIFGVRTIKILKHLLAKGADPTIRQNDGLTPKEFALKNNDTKAEGILGRYEKLWKIRGSYSKWLNENPKPNALSKAEDVERVRDDLIQLFASGAPIPAAPPKDAPEVIIKVYDALKAAKIAPLTVKSEALELKGLPTEYYRLVLKAARTQVGKSTNKFKPSPDTAREVVRAILEESDDTSAGASHEMGAWLLGVASVPVDTKLLDLFSLPDEQLKKDVEKLLELDATKYDGNPNLAAIKLTKALLAYKDEDVGCADANATKSYLKNPKVENVLEWLSQVGNLGTADKLLFARLARLVLEEKPNLCPAARNELIKAMRDWRVKDARVQAELACATAFVIGEGGLEKKEYTDIMLIASAVGFQNDLSQSAAIEQVCSLGKMTNEPGNDLYRETYLGLVRYVAGNPKGGFEMSKKEDGTIKKIPIDATAPRKDAVVKLCKIAAVYTDKKDLSAEEKCFTESFPLFLNSLKADLDKPRAWPTRFLVNDPAEAKLTLRATMGDKLTADSEAIETSCASVQKAGKKALPKPAAKPAQPSPKKLKGDFQP